MDYELTEDYLADVEKRCRRYQGQWCGSIGSYAADAMRLLLAFRKQKKEIAAMQELLDANQKLRDAVEARLAGGCCDGGKCQPKAIDTRSPLPDVDEVIEEDDARLPSDWILQGQRELETAPDDIRWKGDGIVASPPDGLRPGTTAKFGTGAVRSSDVEEFRYDLISPIGLREVARACAEGAAKYGDWNWEKGMPVHDLLNHVLAHIYQFLGGDRSEPHLGHAAWGMLAAIHSLELWPHLNDGHLRKSGCCHPGE